MVALPVNAVLKKSNDCRTAPPPNHRIRCPSSPCSVPQLVAIPPTAPGMLPPLLPQELSGPSLQAITPASCIAGGVKQAGLRGHIASVGPRNQSSRRAPIASGGAMHIRLGICAAGPGYAPAPCASGRRQLHPSGCSRLRVGWPGARRIVPAGTACGRRARSTRTSLA